MAVSGKILVFVDLPDGCLDETGRDLSGRWLAGGEQLDAEVVVAKHLRAQVCRRHRRLCEVDWIGSTEKFRPQGHGRGL